MTELSIDIPIKSIAQLISSMSKQELETLYLLLTEEGAELLERKNDLILKKVTFLDRDEAFNGYGHIGIYSPLEVINYENDNS